MLGAALYAEVRSEVRSELGKVRCGKVEKSISSPLPSIPCFELLINAHACRRASFSTFTARA